MKKLLTGLTALLGLGAVGFVASRAMGSRPNGAAPDNPLPPCPDVPNCFRTSRSYGRPAAEVYEAAAEAVRAHHGLITGRAAHVKKDGLRLDAVFSTGPFRDDLSLVVTGDALGSVLHLRSAARVGNGDLGINRARAESLLDAIGERLAEGVMD